MTSFEVPADDRAMSAESGIRAALDVDSYLERVGYRGPLRCSAEVLADLHLAHATHIPFSTLETLFGPPTPLELGAVEDKLVRKRRGGFCVEHHFLFAELLRAIGFEVKLLAADVRNGPPMEISRSIPRPHVLLSVELDEPWLVDVCFGGGPLLPLRLRPGDVVEQFGWRFRIAPEGERYLVQTERLAGWLDLYSFSPESRNFSDLVMLHHFGTTHPDSILTKNFFASRGGVDAQWTFWLDDAGNGMLAERLPDRSVRHVRVPHEEFETVLTKHLGLDVPSGFGFRRPPVAWTGHA